MEEARTWSEILPAYEDRGLVMLMISIDPSDTEQSIEAFSAQAGIREPLPTVIGGVEIAREFGVNALETTIILDKSGEEIYRDVTISDAETLMTTIEDVL
jgi:hypothetical protein